MSAQLQARVASAPEPERSPLDVRDAVADVIPRALVAAGEIAAALGLPLRKAIPLIIEARDMGLVEIWPWQEKGRSPAVYALLSASEADARSLTLVQHDPRFRLLSESEEDRSRKKRPPRPLLDPRDWKWKKSGLVPDSSAPVARTTTGFDGRLGHGSRLLAQSGDDEAIEDEGLDSVPDLPRRYPPEKVKIAWKDVVKRIRRRPDRYEDEIRAYLRQHAARPIAGRRYSGGRDHHAPNVLVGLGRPHWTPDDERGRSCRVCRDRPLRSTEVCLGCTRGGLDGRSRAPHCCIA